MKLSIAVGILSARSTLLHNAQASIASTSIKKDDRELLNLLGPKSFGKMKTSYIGLQSAATRSLSRLLEDSKLVECNPEATAEARAAADVGVLECGYDEVCLDHVESSMGGFCYETYGMAKVCDPLYTGSDLTCDCSDFDVETGTGSISCLLPPYGSGNMGSSYYGCYVVSTIASMRTSLKDNIYVSRGFCNDFVVGDDTVNSTKLCRTYDMVNGDPFSFNASSCDLHINGLTCASCTLTMDFSEWPQSSKVLEQKADCSNVVDGLIIDNLNQFRHLPIIQACYKPINGTSCSLCADNEYIPVADETAILLDGFGSDFTCGGLGQASNANQLSSDKCVEATVLAVAECCKASASTALSLVSAGILLTGTSFMLFMN